MLISKFDLYKSGWLELVFENRNKEYGAYYLRQHYAGNMLKAMGITLFAIGLLCGAVILFMPANVRLRVVDVIVNPQIIVPPPPIAQVKEIKPPEVKPLKVQPPAPAAATIKFVVPVPTSAPVTDNPPKISDLNDAIGPETTKGTPGVTSVLPESKGDGGTAPTTDETVHNPFGLDALPEPVGGMSAWGKFLNRNIRFPGEAQDQQVSGRVILSFVVEKDGHISNIVVERGAGYGFDEEAVRVLKLAKPWKPGMQNGQPVRVKYTLPFNFQYGEQ